MVCVTLARGGSRNTQQPAPQRRRIWILGLLPLDIPLVSPPKTELSKLGTAYDAAYSQERAPVKIYREAFDAYERLAEVIEGQMQRVWQAQVDAR